MSEPSTDRVEIRRPEVGFALYDSLIEREMLAPSLRDQIDAALLRELPAMAEKWATEYGGDAMYTIEGPTREGDRVTLRLVPARTIREHDAALEMVRDELAKRPLPVNVGRSTTPA